MTQTNASSAALAASLAGARKGTFSGIVQRLVGEERGGVRYGDALVHDVVVTGFSYTRLKERDLKVLLGLTDEDLTKVLTAKKPMAWDRPRAKNAVQVPVTLGRLQDGAYPVRAGLSPADRVVVGNLAQLRSGLTIQPAPPGAAAGAAAGMAGGAQHR